MSRTLSVRMAFVKGLCCLGLAWPLLLPAAGRADFFTFKQRTTKLPLLFFVKEQAAFCTKAGTLEHIDLWVMGTDYLHPASKKYADLRLGVDARMGAVRFGDPDDKGLVTKWNIEKRRGRPCTFQVAEGKFKGWFLCVSAKAEKRVNGEGKAVEAFPLVLVRERNARCLFDLMEIAP
jgi:hypothetical protein